MKGLRSAMVMTAIVVLSATPGCAAPPRNDSRVVARMEKPVNLGPRATRVTLKGESLATRLGSLTRGRRLFLIVGGLRADHDPGVGFEVYIDLPEGVSPTPRHHAGSINYYNAAIGHTGSADAFFSFDITDVARTLRSRGLLRDATTLTIVPSDGTPEGKPVIGRIEIVEQ